MNIEYLSKVLISSWSGRPVPKFSSPESLFAIGIRDARNEGKKLTTYRYLKKRVNKLKNANLHQRHVRPEAASQVLNMEEQREGNLRIKTSAEMSFTDLRSFQARRNNFGCQEVALAQADVCCCEDCLKSMQLQNLRQGLTSRLENF